VHFACLDHLLTRHIVDEVLSLLTRRDWEWLVDRRLFGEDSLAGIF
jgi:hypothetical protein